jgi:hypothetical protein
MSQNKVHGKVATVGDATSNPCECLLRRGAEAWNFWGSEIFVLEQTEYIGFMRVGEEADEDGSPEYWIREHGFVPLGGDKPNVRTKALSPVVEVLGGEGLLKNSMKNLGRKILDRRRSDELLPQGDELVQFFRLVQEHGVHVQDLILESSDLGPDFFERHHLEYLNVCKHSQFWATQTRTVITNL